MGQLPTFLVLGAEKAGTTALHAYLARHPDVFVPATKELNFFLAEGNWNRGVSWYREQFDGGETTLARGESCPQYSKVHEYEGVARRVRDLIPDVRLVYLVRHPLERIRSAYTFYRARGVETFGLEDAVRRRPHYLDTTRYATQIQPYLEVFDAGQLLVLRSDDLRRDRRATIDRTLMHLGVDPTGFPAAADLSERYETTHMRSPNSLVRVARRLSPVRSATRWIPNRWKRTMWAWTGRRVDAGVRIGSELAGEIWAEIEPELSRLERLVDIDLSDWSPPPDMG